VIPNKNTEVVVYCASFDCNASEKAAKKLTELGYTNVIDFSGGKADWKAAEKTALTT
jgi:rhodanese-related sulfurtransferase